MQGWIRGWLQDELHSMQEGQQSWKICKSTQARCSGCSSGGPIRDFNGAVTHFFSPSPFIVAM